MSRWTDPINVPDLGRRVVLAGHLGASVTFSVPEASALLEAVETAEMLRRRMGMGTASALEQLEDALSRFDFEDHA